MRGLRTPWTWSIAGWPGHLHFYNDHCGENGSPLSVHLDGVASFRLPPLPEVPSGDGVGDLVHHHRVELVREDGGSVDDEQRPGLGGSGRTVHHAAGQNNDGSFVIHEWVVVRFYSFIRVEEDVEGEVAGTLGQEHVGQGVRQTPLFVSREWDFVRTVVIIAAVIR